jgi:integrase
MKTHLNVQYLETQLNVPPGKKRVEVVDTGGPPGMYLEIRATSEGEGTYWIRYRRKSDDRLMHHKIGRTTEITLVDARKEATRIRAQVVLGGDPRGATIARREVPTLEEFMRDSVFPHNEPRKRSIGRDRDLMRVHIQDRLGKKRLSHINRQDVESLQSEVLAKGRAPATANHVVKLIRSSLNLAVAWGLLEKNPASRIPMLFEDNKKERYLSEPELQRLLDVLRTDRNRTVCQIILLLLATGMRLNEVLTATWAEVDLERRVFVVRALNSKSKRVRSVPINDSAFEVLDNLSTKGTQGPLFTNPRTGKRYQAVSKQWGRIRKAADLPEFRIHDCRHFFASALVSSGRTLFETQMILGHSSPSTTMRYAWVSTAALQEAASAASAKLTGGVVKSTG